MPAHEYEVPRAHPVPQPAPRIISPMRARAEARKKAERDRAQAGDIWRRWIAAQRTERLRAPDTEPIKFEVDSDGWLL